MLMGLAYRMLGTPHDAEDVLQDAYLKWQNVDRQDIREPRRYLSRTVTRLAVDRLRQREHEPYDGTWLPAPVTGTSTAHDPAESAEQRDSLSIATLFLMERLDPVERAVFVLRAAFSLPYDEIAGTVDRAPEHCRQLYRRATHRLNTDRRRFAPSRAEHRELLERFLAAARDGDLATLRTLLHDHVVTWSDGGGRVRAARHPILGADRVVRFFAGIYTRRTTTVEHLLINGNPGALTRVDGLHHLITFTVVDDRISAMFIMSSPAKIDWFLAGTGVPSR